MPHAYGACYSLSRWDAGPYDTSIQINSDVVGYLPSRVGKCRTCPMVRSSMGNVLGSRLRRIVKTAGYLAIETYESIRQSSFPLPHLGMPNGSYLTPKSTSLFISKSGKNMDLEKASEYSFSVSSTSQQALQSYRYH